MTIPARTLEQCERCADEVRASRDHIKSLEEELARTNVLLEAERRVSASEAARADAEKGRADAEKARADAEHDRAGAFERAATAEAKRADAEKGRADTAEAKLKSTRKKLALSVLLNIAQAAKAIFF